jgi:hypothetical protein
LPTVTVPKLRLVGFGVRSPADAPVPDRAMDSAEFDASDVTVTLPLALPAEVGLNEMWKVVLCPAPSVIGVVTLPRLNPVPLTATCEMLTLVPPVFVTVSDKDEVLPTVTLPKLRLVGLDVRKPGVTPVPDKPTVSGEFEASDVMFTLPLTAPAVWGANDTLNVVLCELASVKGVAIPLS